MKSRKYRIDKGFWFAVVSQSDDVFGIPSRSARRWEVDGIGQDVGIRISSLVGVTSQVASETRLQQQLKLKYPQLVVLFVFRYPQNQQKWIV